MHNDYEYSLDAFRGIAAVLVVFHHISLAPNLGWMAYENFYIFVDFFFMLSGYVMFKVYLNSISNAFDAKLFIVKRIARIYPLHFIMLIVWLFFVILKFYFYSQGKFVSTDPFVLNDYSSFIQNLFLVQAWGLIDHAVWNYPAWSISVEFFLYITFLLYALFFRSFYFCIVCSLVSLLIIIEFSSSLNGEYSLSLIRGLFSFYLGGCAYYLACFTENKNVSFNKSLSDVIQLLLLFFVLCFLLIDELDLFSELVLVSLFFCIIYVFSFANKSSSIISSLLELSFFQSLGKWSYSIYLVHAVMLVFLNRFYVDFLNLGYSEIIATDVGRDKRIIVSDYWLLMCLINLSLIVLVSRFTYLYIELPGKRLLISKFL